VLPLASTRRQTTLTPLQARKQVMSLKKGGAALDVAAELPASAAASATPPVPSPPKPAETSKAPEQEPSLSTMPVPNHLSAQSLGVRLRA
jgi:hypothetical protein